jgi:hypothetical protein
MFFPDSLHVAGAYFLYTKIIFLQMLYPLSATTAGWASINNDISRLALG